MPVQLFPFWSNKSRRDGRFKSIKRVILEYVGDATGAAMDLRNQDEFNIFMNRQE
jgi:hypothetical protein